MARITLPDGRWLDMRTMTVNDELVMDDLGAAGSEAEATTEDDPKAAESAYGRYMGLLRQTKAILVAATTATSWGGDAGDMGRDAMFELVSQWRKAGEDAAVPPG